MRTLFFMLFTALSVAVVVPVMAQTAPQKTVLKTTHCAGADKGKPECTRSNGVRH